MTAMTMKIPTPIPALKIPSITSQLVTLSISNKSTESLMNLFCMISVLWLSVVGHDDQRDKFPKKAKIALTAFCEYITGFEAVYTGR